MTDAKLVSNERRATVDDLSSLVEIERSAFPKERWASEATLACRLELADSETWVSVVEGLAVGFANGFPIKDLSTQAELDPPDLDLYLQGGRVWLLRNVAVRSSFQRQGIGRKLIERQVRAARGYGAQFLRFTTTENLETYFHGLGFRMIQKAQAFHGLPQGVWERALAAEDSDRGE